MKTIYPSEAHEQERFVNWLEDNNYTFCAFAQSTFTRSHAIKCKNMRLGVRPGFPDMCVALPKVGKLVFVEMKKIKGGKISEQQKDWILDLNLCGSFAKVCFGADEAIALVKELDQCVI